MSVAVVVPCFDEAERLDLTGLAELARFADLVVFVDDGSSDATPLHLDLFAATCANVEVVHLPHNVGKAEAVRAGLNHIGDRATVVGYFDADLATPVSELVRMAAVLAERPGCEAVLASRVALLGHAVQRRAIRHYLGRLYATAASIVLAVPVYDTQCGAKLFRNGSTLVAALAEPFPDRWSFDVELLGRLLRPRHGVPAVAPDALVEMPLTAWRDVAGSKLGVGSGVRALAALAGVRRRMHRRG